MAAAKLLPNKSHAMANISSLAHKQKLGTATSTQYVKTRLFFSCLLLNLTYEAVLFIFHFLSNNREFTVWRYFDLPVLSVGEKQQREQQRVKDLVLLRFDVFQSLQPMYLCMQCVRVTKCRKIFVKCKC